MKFIDWFSGIGGFRIGLELAGHECVGFCEYDKHAVMSYRAMHDFNDYDMEDIRETAVKRIKYKGQPFNDKLLQREMRRVIDDYPTKEWYCNDIRECKSDDIPKADMWCGGFPCQDISIAGKQLGFSGERSSLFFELTRLLYGLPETHKPKYVILENVRNLLSIDRGWVFAQVLIEMDKCGYDVEWDLLNTKNYLPQNRERVYIVGHLRGQRTGKVFPIGQTHEETPECEQLPQKGASRVKQIGTRTDFGGEPRNQDRVYATDGIAPTLNTCGGGNQELKIIAGSPKYVDGVRHVEYHEQDIAPTIKATQYKSGDGQPKVAISVITPDRSTKIQNGRRIKEDGEEMFTLTAQDRHGVAVIGGLQEHQHWREDGISPSLTSAMGMGGGQTPLIRQTPRGYNKGGDHEIAPTLSSNSWQENNHLVEGMRIRKLTPLECFRLQGFSDKLFYRAAAVNSDSQLYKQAGNSVSVPVVYEIGIKLY